MRNFGIPKRPVDMSDLRDEYDYEAEQAREWLTMADIWPELAAMGAVSLFFLCMAVVAGVLTGTI